MAFKIVFTEFVRDLHNTLSTFVFALLLGFIVFFVGGLSSYLNKVFESPKWNVDLVILPKGITPELAIANVVRGSPGGLVPLALFNTLLQQSEGSSVKLLGLIPYKSQYGNVEIAVTDPELKDFYELKKESLWRDFDFTDLKLKRPDFYPSDSYQTPEWHDQVLMGILVKGNSTELTKLQNLIDRKTIAQAFFVGNENNGLQTKLIHLKKGLYLVTGFVVLSTLLGLLLALKNMNSKRNSLELVLMELKFERTLLIKIAAIQTGLFILFPVVVGYMISMLSFDAVQRFVFNL